MENRPCRYLLSESSDRVPKVNFDPKDPNVMPCISLVIFYGSQETIAKTLVSSPIPATGCASQRKEGLCPRDLGEKVPANLQINPLAK